MKKIISTLTVLLLIVLISPANQSSAMNANPVKAGKPKNNKKFATIPLRATNSTSDGVYVALENNSGGPSYNFFIPPNTPSNTTIGQIVESSDSYTVKLSSTGGAHDMWVYWEHRQHVTGLSVSGMSIACGSCAVINIFN